MVDHFARKADVDKDLTGVEIGQTAAAAHPFNHCREARVILTRVVHTSASQRCAHPSPEVAWRVILARRQELLINIIDIYNICSFTTPRLYVTSIGYIEKSGHNSMMRQT